MWSAVTAHDPWSWADVEIAVPSPSERLPAISMAGFSFRRRLPSLVEIGMVAHPSLTMIIDLSRDGGIVHGLGSSQRSGSFIAGLLPGHLRAGGLDGECLQIRLSPVVAQAVLGSSAELTGRVFGLELALGREAGRLERSLRAATSWSQRFAIAADFVDRRLQAASLIEPEVDHAWQRTLAAGGTVRIDDLADEVGWNRQRLWSRFRARLGITPKRAAQLVRFDRAAHLLVAGRPPAEAAADTGYADQSHLHREVRAITGTTPSRVAGAPWLAIDDVAWPTGP
ncbi:helix-turn-helix domain-containing protein [Microlunatus elymi]|uniref:helix-turn-helix domain-containing protein n=1 Tax=Microlunatus elymi TaxID=2596828 RepID=UPI001AEFC611|nr:helix-turn-helix domain-containing protein [Microlunatus elymi]